MEGRMVNNLTDVKWITLCMCLLLEVALTSAFDVHITDSHAVGSIVFNASTARQGGVYMFSLGATAGRAVPKFVTNLLGLETVTGEVVLLEKPNCDKIIHNPFTVYVEVRTVEKHRPVDSSACVTLFPLTVHVHGDKDSCFKFRRRSPKHSKSQTGVLISTELDIQPPGQCLAKGTHVLTVAKYLPAFLSDCSLHYKLSKASHFKLKHKHGDLKTTDTVCLKWPYHLITATIKLECGSSKNSLHIPLRIAVYGAQEDPRQRSRRGLSNSPPSFAQESYAVTVPEEQNAGYSIVQITATDPDSGEAGSLTYSLQATQDGRSQNMFTIDPTSGQISTTAKLNRESIAKHYFMVVATDNARRPLSGMAGLTITVDDVNDHVPTFENSQYSQDISESAITGTTVITIRASDGDSGNNGAISYKILNPSGVNTAFFIDQSTGSIVTKQSLDRERTSFYSLVIQASDKALVTERKSSTATVDITVLDENDNKPQFTKSSYSIDISEDIDPSGGPIIAEVQATDDDAGVNAMVRYTITGGNSMDTFSIDAISGQISVQRTLDYEAMSSFRLNIRAQDSGDPPKSNSTTMLIRVVDINDNSPRFYAALYQESVLEDVAVGYTIVRVQAYDQDDGDNADIIYTLKEVPNNLPMTMDPESGLLTTNRKLDREEQARYSFRVEAADQGVPPRTATAAIEITIRDVNDNAPIFEPRVYNEVVSEEVPPGYPVVTVTATDSDAEENARVTYTITSGNVKGAFKLISQMGQGLITVGRSLNYKDQHRYILTVTASDHGGQQDTCSVFINVTDANTYRPEFTGAPYNFRVDENVAVGSTIYKVMATDGDVGENARISYSIAENSIFEINSHTGDIILKSGLDREATAGYSISVTATDHGRPAKSDTTDVEIVVNDVNDNYPKFMQTSYRGLVPEDAVVGTSILTISATDDDQGLNGKVRYTFENGNNGNGDFMIDPTLGILRTAKTLDRETVPQYQLKAFAVDRGPINMEKSTSVIITIQVGDINDNAPEFPPGKLELFIPENSAIESTVGILEAVDPDEGVNAEVEYSIIGGPDADSFSLITRKNEPAVVTSLIELDYEGSKKVYSIIVRAQSFHKLSDAQVTIRVQDVNDNMPQLKDFTIAFNNYKNYFPSEEIGRIPAHDPDVGDKLQYKFVSGNEANMLHLDRMTGMMRLDSRLNSDVPHNGSFVVSVTDGINEVRATCDLYVRLVTEEMLNSSITVRLNNIDQNAFLSPLFKRFTTALATIIPTTEDNIFMINVQDDTDVRADILNISFSVRQRVEEQNDVFYSSQFLRERVYLQRVLLAKLSTLEVLPFDDNLCMREPCLNYEECIATLKFNNASGFISTDTMLFRPIYPLNTIQCKCPHGFTGMDAEYVCDTEVNLCYSSPCGQNGTCARREGGYTCQCRDGYTGDQCEIPRHHKKYDACPEGVCRAGSRCVPLIKEGFRCELCPSQTEVLDGVPGASCQNCRDIPYHTDYCQLDTRSFTKGSFLMFPSLKKRHRFHVELQFATRERNALLFYNGRYNEEHDFIALEILDGQVQFSFSLGTHVTKVKATVEGGVNDGNWHEVKVDYLNRTATLTVGEWCDTELVVQHGFRLGGYRCAARATQYLEDNCVDVTEICHRFLDLTGPFQIGGLPNLPAHFQVQNKDFEGCIRNVYIDSTFLDLGDFVYNNGSVAGCPQKQSFCHESPCLNDGTCYEAWGSYRCECSPRHGGKDCSHDIEGPRRLKGSGFMEFSTKHLDPIRLPWYNGLSFRTRQDSAILMSIPVLAAPTYHIKMEMVDGYVHYIHPRATVILDARRVNDGKWHFIEARWMAGGALYLILDYGQSQTIAEVDDWLTGNSVGSVFVGGLEDKVGTTTHVLQGLEGCVENVRVGNLPISLLKSPRHYKTSASCIVEDSCRKSPCTGNAYCTAEFDTHRCTCQPGYVGDDCEPICTKYTPCQHTSKCVMDPDTPEGYHCECPDYHAGEYCEERMSHVCPSTWWGQPICGPCHCPVGRGFNPSCDKATGACSCKENHYQPPGSDTCFPCNCYIDGAINGSCDPISGQCLCRPTVFGRACDECSSDFSEVTRRGCEVLYEDCPKHPQGGVLWKRTGLGNTAQQDCPSGTIGRATRHCHPETGWEDANLFNCTSTGFLELKRENEEISLGQLQINTFVAKSLMAKLDTATEETEELYGSDVNTAYLLINNILEFENRQSGLNLTHTQDRNFIQNLVNSVGRITDSKHKQWWGQIQEGAPGVVLLLQQLERYLHTLAYNMQHVFTQPFDIVHSNMVLGLDSAIKGNFTSIKVPKYNNKVQNSAMFDKGSTAHIPAANLKPASMADMVTELVHSKKPQATVSYILYKSIGDLLPAKYDDEVRRAPVPQVINSAVFTLVILDGEHALHKNLKQPVALRLRQLQQHNRTGTQCAFWRFTHSDNGPQGQWSTDGCQRVSDVVDEQGERYVTCQCDHLTSFAVLSDVSSVELSAQAVRIELATYSVVAVALLCLMISFVAFCCIRGTKSNANSIHINLVFCIFVAYLIFIVGIGWTDPQLMCKVIAITLHYFFMCSFAWMFVEGLHLYRMMTDIRNIDQGTMPFYYTLGYVIPGIVVGLAVGLDTDSYGNEQFCWLKTSDLLIWSFAGPICVIMVLNIIVFFMTVRVSCRGKTAGDPEFSLLKNGLKAAVVLLPLLGMAWVFALLAANDNVMAFQYLFAIFACLQGLFILLAHIIFNKRARTELKYTLYRMQGKKGFDDSLSHTRTSQLSRSALAYHHNESSLEGGLSRVNVGICTNSTTSRSTSKSSGAMMYPPDAYMHSSSTSTNMNIPSVKGYPPNAGIPPYGYDVSMFHQKAIDDPDTGERKRRAAMDYDSDSEISALEHSDMELASSHSSDDDEDDGAYGLGKMSKGKSDSMQKAPPISPIPVHSTPAPPYQPALHPGSPRSHWPSDNHSVNNASDCEKTPKKVTISDKPVHIPDNYAQGSKDRLISPARRVDSVASHDTANKSPKRDRIAVQVLTHNGSITSESETTGHETTV